MTIAHEFSISKSTTYLINLVTIYYKPYASPPPTPHTFSIYILINTIIKN